MTRLASVVISVTVLFACSDDTGGDIDAAVDAPVDVAIDASGPCGNDYQMTGEYIDWDSTNASFMGVPNATWTVVGDTPRTAMTAPNGRILLCLRTNSESVIDITQTAAPYISARLVADPAVLSVPGGVFSARGLRMANATASYDAIMSGMTYDMQRAHVLVVKRGTPTAITIGSQASFVSDGPDDVTWTAGATGAFVFFPNVPVGTGTVTLGGTFTGPRSVDIQANYFTIVPIS